MKSSQVVVEQEYRAGELAKLIRDRVGHGSRRGLYEWMHYLGIKPDRYYSQRDAAKLLYFAFIVKKRRSKLIAAKAVFRLLDQVSEEEFIRQAFNCR